MSELIDWDSFINKYKIRKNLDIYDVMRIYSTDRSYFFDLFGYIEPESVWVGSYWKDRSHDANLAAQNTENEFLDELFSLLYQKYKIDNEISDTELRDFLSISSKPEGGEFSLSTYGSGFTRATKEGDKNKIISEGDQRGFTRIGVHNPTARSSYSGIKMKKYMGHIPFEFSPLKIWKDYKFLTGLSLNYSLEDYLNENPETFSDGWEEDSYCKYIWKSGKKKGTFCDEKCPDFRLLPKLIPSIINSKPYFTFLSQRTISIPNRCKKHLRPWVVEKENSIIIDIETENFTCGWLAPDNGKSKLDYKLKFRVAVVYCYNNDRYYTYFEDQIEQLFEKIETSDNIISYNGEGFDFDVLKSHGYNLPISNSIDICKKLENWTGIRRSLDYYGRKYFGIKKQTKGKEMEKIAGKELAKACMEDVKLTKLIYEKPHKIPSYDTTKIRSYSVIRNEAKYTNNENNVFTALKMGKDRNYYSKEWFSWAINHLQKVIDKGKIDWLKEDDIALIKEKYHL
jgi:hypothetical protein